MKVRFSRAGWIGVFVAVGALGTAVGVGESLAPEAQAALGPTKANRAKAARAKAIHGKKPTPAPKPTPPPDSDETFSMVCRGPFQLNGGPRLRILAQKASVAADFGRPLDKGQCALSKRPLRDDEHAEIMVFPDEGSHATDVTYAATAAPLSACALDENCTLRMSVKRQNKAFRVNLRHEFAISRRRDSW